MVIIMALVSGLMMSIGLIVSGMVNPLKVIGFLDLFGHFDPTLAFVMVGALGVAAIGYRLVGCSKPLLCESFDLPKKSKIDAPLILGAALFGIGWGLAGFCPAPAIVGLGLGLPKALLFVCAMLVGMFLARRWALRL
ncbi:MAG: YeeE/YedE family protein [Candidatus Omnitrophica bacterium]|nr:YeeE/YedE family protein [Candidatus Omnitrophota bacterium]